MLGWLAKTWNSTDSTKSDDSRSRDSSHNADSVQSASQTPAATSRLVQVAGDRRNSQRHDANIEQLFASEIFDVVNEYREQIRLRPVVRFDRIDELCLEHCLYMYNNNDFSHANFDRSTRISRGELVLQLGFATAAENLASAHAYEWQFLDTQERELNAREKILGGWLGSPGHRGTIEMGSHTHSGMSVIIRPSAEYPDYVQCFVTQIFAS